MIGSYYSSAIRILPKLGASLPFPLAQLSLGAPLRQVGLVIRMLPSRQSNAPCVLHIPLDRQNTLLAAAADVKIQGKAFATAPAVAAASILLFEMKRLINQEYHQKH